MELQHSDIEGIRRILAVRPVKRAYVFGSYGRDEADEDSDIDILVELDYSIHLGLGFVKMKSDLEEILHRKVDLVTEQSLSKHLSTIINTERKLIYER